MRPRLQRLGILGSPSGSYVRQLAGAALRRNPGCELALLSFADMSVALSGSRVRATTLAASADNTLDLPSVDLPSVNLPSVNLPSVNLSSVDLSSVDLLALDGLIVRTMPLGSLEQVIFRMDALQAIEHAGVPILNPPRALEVSIDKWLTLERLSRLGVATPATMACQSRAAAMEAFEEFGRDVVVKPLFGGEGRGIVRVSDADMAWRVFGTLSQIGSVLYVQQFLPHFGYDIRVLKVGNRLLSIKRRAVEDGWRTNISQGSLAEAHSLTEDEVQLTQAAAQATGGTLLGIDLLPTCSGLTVVLEVNAVPGWKGTSAALGVDVADLVIEHLEELHAERT